MRWLWGEGRIEVTPLEEVSHSRHFWLMIWSMSIRFGGLNRLVVRQLMDARVDTGAAGCSRCVAPSALRSSSSSRIAPKHAKCTPRRDASVAAAVPGADHVKTFRKRPRTSGRYRAAAGPRPSRIAPYGQ